MGKKIYIITYATYTESDNYLYNGIITMTDKAEADKVYKEWCKSTYDYAKGVEGQFKVGQIDAPLTEETKKYMVNREIGTENGYQAIIELNMIEV